MRFVFLQIYSLFSLLSFGFAEDKTLLAHYMPWYASKPVSGQWGWHWTMGHFDPEKADENGRREAASVDYPLLGLYDSGDPDLLECHVLLMKYTGLDGVMVDWYGTKDFYDYRMIHENTQALFSYIKKAGLKFAVCYEDQSIGAMVEKGVLTEKEGIEEGKRVMGWLEENWFGDDCYLKRSGKPVLAVFGPQYFSKEAWREVMGHLKSPADVYALPHLSESHGIEGAFSWVPVTGGKNVAAKDWLRDLNRYYEQRKRGLAGLGIVFPGFEDIYQRAGVHDSYGFIDSRDGKTFTETLELAMASNCDIIQIATWNDYGEGTVIEPTANHGYRYLELLQKRLGKERDLRLPVQLYQYRKRFQHLRDPLDEVSALLFSGELEKAKSMLAEIEHLE